MTTFSQTSAESIRRQLDETIEELQRLGPAPTLAGEVAPPPRRNRIRVLMAVLGLLLAGELAMIMAVSRLENLDGAVATADPCRAPLAAIEAGLAGYRSAKGELPISLAQLVPEYMTNVPGTVAGPIEYTVAGAGYTLRCPGTG